jgi:hypothetical protein
MILAAPLLLATVSGIAAAGEATADCADDWAVHPSPSPGAILNSLNGVAVLSNSDSWAVGFEGSIEDFEFVYHPIIEHWNGTRWSLVPVAFGHGQLADVEAIGRDDVWAVGQSGQDDEASPITLHWDGVAWTEIPIPFVERGYLLDVSASSARDVWAVGIVTGTFETLVARWNGQAWTYVEHPSPGRDYVSLGAVHAYGPQDVWIAGNFQRGETDQIPFSEHWDGTRWTVVPMPNVGTQGVTVDALAAAGDGLWAVGNARFDDFTSRTLTERWNGRRWEVVESPTPGASGQLLGAVAVGPHLWAVGSVQDEGSQARTLTMRHDRRGWKVITSPDVGTLGNVLLDVAAGPGDELWSVGFFQRPGVNRTLTMRRCEE